MSSRLLLALLVAALIGVSACGKTEQSGQDQGASQTGAAEEQQSAGQSAPESGQGQ